MAKASTALPTTSHRINRRTLFRGGSIAAVALAAPIASHASGMVAAPSPAGRHILRLIAEQRALQPVWEVDEDAASARSDALFDAIEALGKFVTSQPIASFSDVVDRAILAAWACQPHGGKLVTDDIEGLRVAYIVDVVALAGIRPDQCNAELVMV